MEHNIILFLDSLQLSFASVLVQRGISRYAVKELLGHGNIKTTQTCPPLADLLSSSKRKPIGSG